MHTVSGVVTSEVATRKVQGTVVPTHQQEGQRNKGEAKRIHSKMQIHNSNHELHRDGKPLAPASGMALVIVRSVRIHMPSHFLIPQLCNYCL